MRISTSAAAASVLVALALGGCNTTEALNPAAIQPIDPPIVAIAPGAPLPDGAAPPATAPVLPAAASPSGNPVAIAAGDVRIQFAPVVGATLNAARPLSSRLSARTAERGLALAVAGTHPPTHVLKGYFSAIGEGRETLVIFVWDVLGPEGNRLHRIQGQERVAAIAADPWSVVPPQTMETIADRTMEQFAQWLATRPG